MNVLHLAAGNLSGGAARGALGLHRGLVEIGVESVLVNNGGSHATEDSHVVSLGCSPWGKAKWAIARRFGSLPIRLYWKRQRRIFNTGLDGVDVTRLPAYENADIVHLHWVNGLVRMGPLRKVKKPVVWTVRDMWPMTGGCHYAMGCENFKEGCGRCPQLRSSLRMDLSRAVVAYKQRALPANLQVVGISDWVSDVARSSQLFRNRSVRTISNSIDTKSFVPMNKVFARKALGLPLDSKIVLLGAQNIADFYKGFDLLIDAMCGVTGESFELVQFGSANSDQLEQLGRDVRSLGHLSDDASLRLAYSAADVFVAPSRMEAFGKTLVESMACGTPVVCFDATGPKDIVKHKVTGYKATPFDPFDLARGIKWTLSRTAEEMTFLQKASRDRAVKQFDVRVAALKYRELYQKLLIS